MHYLTLRRSYTLLLIAANAVKDCRQQRIFFSWTLASTICGIFLTIAVSDCSLSYLAGFSIAGAVFAVSLLAKDSIGGGDALILSAMSAFLPWEEVLASLTIGLVLSSLYALFLIVVRHKGKKDAMPFIPFLWGGYILALFL